MSQPTDQPPAYDRFTGLSDAYRKYRPQLPAGVLEAVMQFAQCKNPELVVDLGSGSGLSSFVWAPYAKKVIGVEPNEDFIAAARKAAVEEGHANVSFCQAMANQTTLPAESVDIVSSSSSFHWMEPETTLKEVARILKPGGVFAVFDYLLPPTIGWQAEAAFMAYEENIRKRKTGRLHGNNKWPRHEHLERMRYSGHFSFTKEFSLHHQTVGSADRLVGLAMTSARTGKLLREGLTEEELGLDVLRKEACRHLGDGEQPWFLSYDIRVGIKGPSPKTHAAGL